MAEIVARPNVRIERETVDRYGRVIRLLFVPIKSYSFVATFERDMPANELEMYSIPHYADTRAEKRQVRQSGYCGRVVEWFWNARSVYDPFLTKAERDDTDTELRDLMKFLENFCERMTVKNEAHLLKRE